MTKRDPLENFDSVFEFISNFATLNPSFICYCEIRSRNANKGKRLNNQSRYILPVLSRNFLRNPSRVKSP